MFAGESREQLRRHYLAAWRKFSAREPLAEALWEAQRSGRPPDEQAYLERLRRL